MREELLEQRHANLTVYDDDSQEIFAADVHWQDEDGNWHKIDNDFIENTQAEPRSYDYITKSNRFTVGIKKDPSLPEFIKLTYKRGLKGNVSYTLLGMYLYDSATGNKIRLAAPNAVPPSVEGNKVTYANVFPGIDFNFSVEDNGLKELVVIRSEYRDLVKNPAAVGFNPESTKVVFIMQIFSRNGMVEKDILKFLDSTGEETMLLIPMTAENMNKGPMDVYSCLDNEDELLYGFSWKDLQYAAYPILLDPTVIVDNTMNVSLVGCLKQADTSTGGAISVDASGRYIGTNYWETQEEDGKGDVWTILHFENWRTLVRFNLADQFLNKTIYNTQLQFTVSTAGQAMAVSAAEMNNFGTVDGSDWNLSNTIVTDFGSLSISGIGVKQFAANQTLRNRMLYARSAADKTLSVRLKAVNESVNSVTKHQINSDSIIFKSYDSIDQYDPVYDHSTGKVTVRWTNGGGLASGDAHRIYFMAGIGLTADQVIAQAAYVETGHYSENSIDIPGLTVGTYTFVVVDLMKNSYGSFLGARSNVKTVTVESGRAYCFVV